jgi:hypothetical protein
VSGQHSQGKNPPYYEVWRQANARVPDLMRANARVPDLMHAYGGTGPSSGPRTDSPAREGGSRSSESGSIPILYQASDPGKRAAEPQDHPGVPPGGQQHTGASAPDSDMYVNQPPTQAAGSEELLLGSQSFMNPRPAPPRPTQAAGSEELLLGSQSFMNPRPAPPRPTQAAGSEELLLGSQSFMNPRPAPPLPTHAAGSEKLLPTGPARRSGMLSVEAKSALRSQPPAGDTRNSAPSEHPNKLTKRPNKLTKQQR